MQHTFWAEKRDIGKTVGGLLAGIVLVDLLAVQHVAPEVAVVLGRVICVVGGGVMALSEVAADEAGVAESKRSSLIVYLLP